MLSLKYKHMHEVHVHTAMGTLSLYCFYCNLKSCASLWIDAIILAGTCDPIRGGFDAKESKCKHPVVLLLDPYYVFRYNDAIAI